MKQLQTKILGNRKVAPDFYKMRIESPYLAKTIQPGQFVEVRCGESTDPLLRRPFGAHRILKNGIEILYEVVGKGTGILAHKKPGDVLDIIGPLGNGFNLPAKTAQCRPQIVLVAGGIGVAPLLALAEKASLGCKTPASGKNLYALIGAKAKSHILCENEFKKAGARVLVSTEDGSNGKKGLITDYLKDVLWKLDDGIWTVIYACGPNGMLEAVWDIASEKGAACQFSFESMMACGVGVCLGCPIKVARGPADFEYKMVCKDGPVFNGSDIVWK